MRKSRGFTLIEIIIVLVILAILAAAAIPSMIGFIAESKKSICISNRGVILRTYDAQKMLIPDATVDKLLKAQYPLLPQADLDSLACPRGGLFRYDRINKTILCSICDADKFTTFTAVEELTNLSKISFEGKSAKEIMTMINQKLGNSKNTVNNDRLREYLLNIYEGSWPKLDCDLVTSGGKIISGYYIQPILGAPDPNEMVIFATSDRQGHSQWKTNFVYGRENDVWYEYVGEKPQDGFMLTGKTIGSNYGNGVLWSDLKKNIEEIHPYGNPAPLNNNTKPDLPL